MKTIETYVYGSLREAVMECLEVDYLEVDDEENEE